MLNQIKIVLNEERGPQTDQKGRNKMYGVTRINGKNKHKAKKRTHSHKIFKFCAIVEPIKNKRTYSTKEFHNKSIKELAYARVHEIQRNRKTI